MFWQELFRMGGGEKEWNDPSFDLDHDILFVM